MITEPVPARIKIPQTPHIDRDHITYPRVLLVICVLVGEDEGGALTSGNARRPVNSVTSRGRCRLRL
jgi:hypothetical protein